MITERIANSERIVECLKLSQKSQLKNLRNTMTYKYLFSINCEINSITFICESESSKNNLMMFVEQKVLNKLLAKALSKNLAFQKFRRNPSRSKVIDKDANSFLIEVLGKIFYLNSLKSLQGAIKRGVNNFRPYTVYIIEILYKEFFKMVFIRFGNLIQIHEKISIEHKNIILPKLPKRNWWKTQNIEIIESRALWIENFLYTILSSQEILEDRSVMSILGYYKINSH